MTPIERATPPKAHVPALVAGIDLNGLGVVRSLAAAGIPVVAIDVNFSKPTASTRFGRKIRVSALSGHRFISDLLAIRARFDTSPVLILTQEASVETLSAEREQLGSAYRFRLPEHPIVETLLDKTLFQSAAQRLGFRIPRSVTVNADFKRDQIRDIRFPCVLKPATKDDGYARRFAKAYRVESAEEVERLWEAISQVIGTAILQEWIVGDDSDVYFCLQYRDRVETAAASFVGRKIRQWPPLVGGTASCVPAPEFAGDLSPLTDAFFKAVGFCGFCSMEYKRDRRDGEFYMVEPTVGRTDYQEEVATLNGINIPAIGYWRELGHDIDQESKRQFSPVGWRDPAGDAYARAAAPAVNDPAPTQHYQDAYFRLDDPGPYAMRQLGRVAARLSKLARSPLRALPRRVSPSTERSAPLPD